MPTILILILLLVSGMGAGSPAAPHPGGTAGTPGVQTPLPGAPLLVTNADSGRHVTLHVGQAFQVRLRDRSWSLPVVNGAILQIAPLNEMLVRGLTGWNYRAIAPGQTTLTTMGSCLPAPSGISCASIIRYQVTITVVP